MIGQLYSTAENAPGSLAWRLKTRQLEAARQLGRCIGGIVIAAVFLIAAGDAFGLLFSNTDSAAPVGVYLVVSGEPKRGDLVAACLPIAIAQQGLARGYVRTGSCPGDAEPVGKIIGALPGIRFKWNGAGFLLTASASRGARWRNATAPAVRCGTCHGESTWLALIRSGCSASTIRGAGTRAISVQSRGRTCAANSNPLLLGKCDEQERKAQRQ